MRLIRICLAALLALTGVAQAQTIEAPLRIVYTDIKAENIVEDCFLCSPPDRIYFITVVYRATFGDPESVVIGITQSRDLLFRQGTSSEHDFGDFVFSRNTSDPAALLPGIAFVDEETPPMLFGVVGLMAERNPSLNPDALTDIVRNVMREVLVPKLEKSVGGTRLSISEIARIPIIAQEVQRAVINEAVIGVGDVIGEQLLSGFNPDHKLGTLQLSGTAFRDPARARQLVTPAGVDFVSLSAGDIGKRMTTVDGVAVYDAQRLARIRAVYGVSMKVMVLE
ncbi:MAG: hypothetical protein AAF281_09745 [Pseudomonadota bacterium]